MPKPQTQDERPLYDVILAYLFAAWHLRKMPRETAAQRLQRATWCRDHCTTFAGRWFVIGLACWMVQLSPLGAAFTIGRWPLLALVFIAAFVLGIGHLALQIVAQKRAGPPKIDPPSDWPREDR